MPRHDATHPFAPFLEAPRAAALLVDYDGSLAPIVDRPEDARPLPEAVGLLDRLTGGLGLVAVVSGRTVEFLRNVLPTDGIVLVGHYGLERWDHGRIVTDPRVAEFAPAIARAAEEADRLGGGIRVERKGALSFTLHWRTAPDREEVGRAAAIELARRHGLDEPRFGRRAVELRPPVPIDKGTAVESLLDGFGEGERIRAAAFAGDDLGDLPAFDALDRLSASGALQHAVRVGVQSSEAPPELLARADVVVDGPPGLAVLLARLADAL